MFYIFSSWNEIISKERSLINWLRDVSSSDWLFCQWGLLFRSKVKDINKGKANNSNVLIFINVYIENSI